MAPRRTLVVLHEDVLPLAPSEYMQAIVKSHAVPDSIVAIAVMTNELRPQALYGTKVHFIGVHESEEDMASVFKCDIDSPDSMLVLVSDAKQAVYLRRPETVDDIQLKFVNNKSADADGVADLMGLVRRPVAKQELQMPITERLADVERILPVDATSPVTVPVAVAASAAVACASLKSFALSHKHTELADKGERDLNSPPISQTFHSSQSKPGSSPSAGSQDVAVQEQDDNVSVNVVQGKHGRCRRLRHMSSKDPRNPGSGTGILVNTDQARYTVSNVEQVEKPASHDKHYDDIDRRPWRSVRYRRNDTSIYA
eukprot:jgi/Hompol1/2627/HPOL_006086-RA